MNPLNPLNPLNSFKPLLVLAVMMALAGCSSQKFLAEGEYLLHDVRVTTDNREVEVEELEGFVRQHPNSKWFGLVRVPLGVYCMSGKDSTRWMNRFLRRLGEDPVRYDTLLSRRTHDDIEAAVRHMGYLGATVTSDTTIHRHKVDVTHQIHTGRRYRVRHIDYDISDAAVRDLLVQHDDATLLTEGMPFDVNVLKDERARITALLQDNGYYRFNNSFVRYDADTLVGDHEVDLVLSVLPYQASARDTTSDHPLYRIGQVTYSIDADSLHPRRPSLKHDFLHGRSALRTDSLYSARHVQETYRNLSALPAVMRANISMAPSAEDDGALDATVHLIMAKRHGISAELEGTNTAGDFGAAANLSYEYRNLFRRSTSFGFKLRGAYEAITGLEGYADQNYIEYGGELSLNFPELLVPFLSRDFHRNVTAQSSVNVMFSSQDRPEFHRRVLTAAWRYKWGPFDQRTQHRFDLLDLNYVFLPWISETFRRDYLTDNGDRNAILRYNYEDLFVMKWGYTFYRTNASTTGQDANYGTNAYSLRLSIETAGNLLYGLSNLFNGPRSAVSGGQQAYTLFGIAYAQYAKFDFDFSKSFRVDDRNSFGLHVAFGAAFPYANSTVLPYEERYFSGGANSVRGWSVRGLGPGSFSGSDGQVDFIRQTGDLKLDLSVEWRTHLFWKLDGAAFVDAGNIWTLRDYEEQPGGQFRFDTFYRQIAVAYGLGLRLNFGFFIIRLDGGMKAINPAYASGRLRYPIIYPNFKRDFQLHFAVGLPF